MNLLVNSLMVLYSIIKSKYFKDVVYILIILGLFVCLMFSNRETLSLERDIESMKLTQAKLNAELMESQFKHQQLLAEKANEVSTTYEEAIQLEQVKAEVVEREIEKIINVPVYRNVCLDDSGLHLINQLMEETKTTNTSGSSTDSSKPSK